MDDQDSLKQGPRHARQAATADRTAANHLNQAITTLHAQPKAASAAGLRQRPSQGERQLSLLPKPI